MAHYLDRLREICEIQIDVIHSSQTEMEHTTMFAMSNLVVLDLKNGSGDLLVGCGEAL